MKPYLDVFISELSVIEDGCSPCMQDFLLNCVCIDIKLGMDFWMSYIDGDNDVTVI